MVIGISKMVNALLVRDVYTSKLKEIKVAMEPPKEKPPDKKKLGVYCVRSNVYVTKGDENGKLLAKITGRSSDWDIIPMTVRTCKTVKNGRIREGYCSEPDVRVEKWSVECDGNVYTEVYNKK